MDEGAPETLTLHAGRATAELFPSDGGRLGQVTVDGRKLLRGPEAAYLGWGHWGAYPLLPWSNRIPDGRFEYRGRFFEVPVNWEDGSALHGLVAWEPWTVVSSTEVSAHETIEVDVGPYHVRGDQRFELTDTHLELALSVTNLGAMSLPVGLGIHPWFPSGPVEVPAELRWPGDGPMPDGPARPVRDDEDLRTRCRPPPMDRCYTGLTESAATVPGGMLEWDGPVSQVVVYSEHPDWVCVEPVTMANDGFALHAAGASGTGVIELAPGDTTTVRYRFRW